MIDFATLRRLWFQAVLLALAAFIVFLRLLPLSPGFSGLPGPDLLLAIVFAWVLRRPEYVPVLLVAALFFLTDMLFQRPPGLHTALVVLATEFLRSRAIFTRDMPFAVEWGMVVVVMALIVLAERLLMGLAMVDQVSFGLSVIRLVMTMAVYPLAVLLSVYVLRVRRILPGEAEALRQGG